MWLLGLSLLLLLFGGIGVDYWRGLALQRELAAVADSAAIAAASGIDEVHYRDTGVLVLDGARARRLAQASADFQGVPLSRFEVMVSPDGLVVSVLVESVFDLGLLGALIGGAEPVTVRATASAGPRLVP